MFQDFRPRMQVLAFPGGLNHVLVAASTSLRIERQLSRMDRSKQGAL